MDDKVKDTSPVMSAERVEDVVDAEKAVDSRRRSSETLRQTAKSSRPEKDTEEEDEKHTMSESQALDHARANPTDTSAIYLSFSKNDSENPRNWPKWKRWYITLFACMLNNLTTWCASSVALASMQIGEEFDVSSEVTTLLLSMYVLGFAIGPMVMAPLSEYYGRNPVYIVSWLGLVIFHIPLALAPNIGTLIVCRLIAGVFGSAPLTNTGGTISDLWRRNDSGGPLCFYGISSTFSPNFALVVSGYIVQEKGWRLQFWIDMAIVGGFWVLFVLTVPETRHTTILDRKTERVRKIMKKENLAAAETMRDANADEKKGLHTLFAITLTRPFRFLFTEPITLYSAAYNGFIYGIVYIFNEALPLVFGETGHGFGIGAQGLSFLGLCVGVLIAAATYPFIQERYYLKRVAANDGKGVPEARMYTARVGAIFIPISLFWFAWTSFVSVPWIVPIIASAFFGAGIYMIILGILSYIIDSYQGYSASSLAGVILVRNTVGAGFPLFARQMYQKLGYEWATSLLGFLSILLVPIPFYFFYRGESVRYRSPWAREHFEQDEDKPH